jgi:hypothetical protein
MKSPENGLKTFNPLTQVKRRSGEKISTLNLFYKFCILTKTKVSFMKIRRGRGR